MKNGAETRKRAQFLFSKREKGELTGKEYGELRLILNDFIRAARKESSDFLPEHEKPEVFLLELFNSKIFYTVVDFIKNFGLLKQARQEQRIQGKWTVKLEETGVFREWLNTSRTIVLNIILGDSTPRKDKPIGNFLKKFNHSEDKGLFLENRNIKADRDALLGQEGTHKKEPEDVYRTPEYLEECRKLSTQFDMDNIWDGLDDEEAITGDGFLVRDLVAQDIAAQAARERKEYNPDFISPRLKLLHTSKKLADLALEQWKRGEIPQIKTESDCLAWIKAAFTEGLSLEDLQKEIDDFPPERSDLIISIFGRQGERGKLYERLRDFFPLQADKAKDITTFSVLTEAIANEKNEDKIVRKSLEEQASCDISLESLTEEDIRKLLSPKQCKIWDCVCEGKTPQEIAIVLGQSERNIQKHLKNIRKIWDRHTKEK